VKKRIIISVTSDLATDQRVLKTANSCHKNGYDVLLVGRKLKNSLPINTPFVVKRFRLLFNRSALFYAEYNIRLFFLLLFSRADIFLSNDTDTLLANYFASKIHRKKLVFDAHELFPEVPELTNRPKIKRIWEKIENRIFPKLKYSYTVCQSIANYYNLKYGTKMQIVRNAPYYKEYMPTEKKLAFGQKKIILYQGALNVGRGLEWVINTMSFVENAMLVIIGDGDIQQQLEKQAKELNLSDKVVFLGKIPANELYEYTISANIGLCLLENRGLSYYFSLPNRIFDYIQARVPVLASDFPEISKIVKHYNTGKLIDNYAPEKLAETISKMLEKPIDTQHFANISKELCWENEEKILLKIIEI
jgi:glycosyltransferase involved in cell wall biosynthesis